MIGKKAKSKQGNSRKPAAKEKKVVAAKSQPTKEAKEPQERANRGTEPIPGIYRSRIVQSPFR